MNNLIIYDLKNKEINKNNITNKNINYFTCIIYIPNIKVILKKIFYL